MKVQFTPPFEIGLNLTLQNYFLGLQIKQLQNGTFLSQSKYYRDVLKKFEMDGCKEASTPITTSCYLDADEHGTTVDQTKFRGCSISQREGLI